MASGRDACDLRHHRLDTGRVGTRRGLTSNSHLPPSGVVMTRSTLLDPATEPVLEASVEKVAPVILELKAAARSAAASASRSVPLPMKSAYPFGVRESPDTGHRPQSWSRSWLE